MDKIQKYLMLLFVTILSFAYTACGGDDDEPEKSDISMAGELNTVVVSLENGGYQFEEVTVDIGCQIYHHPKSYYGDQIYVTGGKIVYAGDFQNLSNITAVPKSIDSSIAPFHAGGCYIIHSNTGRYIRLKIIQSDATSETYQFQSFIPTNI